MTDEEIVMYLIARTDLGMSSGKLAAQVGHGVQLAMRKAEQNNPFDDDASALQRWEANDYPKIVLGGDKRDFERMLKLAGESQAVGSRLVRVVDNGRTEIPEGSITVLAFVPMRRVLGKQWFKRLRLYK